MSEVLTENLTSSATTDVATTPELHPATKEAEILEHNNPVGQPALPDGTATGAKPAPISGSPTGTVSSNNVEVESHKNESASSAKGKKADEAGKPHETDPKHKFDSHSKNGHSKVPARQQAKTNRGNLTIIDPNEKLGSGYTKDERDSLSKLYEQTLNKLTANEVVKGRIVAITASEVAIDIGFKSEGVVSKSEFNNTPNLNIGDEVEVFLETIEDKEGRLVLSRKRAEFVRTWQKIIEAQKTGEVLQARCDRRIKGGMVVDLLGVEAFLPGSQIDVKPVRDFDAFLGKTLDVRVVKINHPNENVVVSHKVLLEEHLHDQRKDIVEKLERGQVLEGTVKAIADFGAFVDLGGVDGLVHITDLSWGRVQHPTEIIKLDQVVTVVVLDFDENKKRISLGMKQLTPHPWQDIESRYQVGQKVTGRVVSMTDYGAFIELEKGIEGLIHVSEMSWTQHIKHPSQLLQMGQDTEAIILHIDQESKKISLGIKQLEPDPWSLFLEKYPMGSKHRGIVRNLTNFGAFIELEPGVDGLVHISDLSWTKKVRHPGEVLKKGEEIDIMILGIDLDNRRISLGHKQVLQNPWENLETIYGEGKDTEGKIVRIIDKGVIVELPMGVDGFVPISQLAFYPIKNIQDSFKVDDTLNCRVIEFDAENKKIVLSATEWLKSQDRSALEEFNAKHPIPKDTLEEMQKRREEKPATGRGRKKAAPVDASVDPAKLLEQAPSPAELGSFELPEEMLTPEKGTETEGPAAEGPTAEGEIAH